VSSSEEHQETPGPTKGTAYQARQATDCTGKSPVYRFWSRQNSAHFFTISEQEKNIILSTYPDNVWRYEGVAYYVE
jgi:hypothetical protein